MQISIMSYSTPTENMLLKYIKTPIIPQPSKITRISLLQILPICEVIIIIVVVVIIVIYNKN